mmetsp:Transcript_11240/g.32611  ORF Transcript_11240/g.32611 Transcript_11240/m.32611 type:complete len:109 (-) Transcript_11240:797-1123(-)
MCVNVSVDVVSVSMYVCRVHVMCPVCVYMQKGPTHGAAVGEAGTQEGGREIKGSVMSCEENYTEACRRAGRRALHSIHPSIRPDPLRRSRKMIHHPSITVTKNTQLAA